MVSELPPGQQEIDTLPRFGLTRFIHRFPSETRKIVVDVGGDIQRPLRLSGQLAELERVDQVSDFHCVTTWTRRNLRWSGFRFADFYRSLVVPEARPEPDATRVVFTAQDGYRVGLLLEDALAPDVLLADRLDGRPLPIANGAPLRVVAPAHYGYKSAKHVSKIEFWNRNREYRPAAFRFMDHPRARVRLEERGSGFPGWILRYLYRPLIGPTRRRFEQALVDYKKKTGDPDSP